MKKPISFVGLLFYCAYTFAQATGDSISSSLPSLFTLGVIGTIAYFGIKTYRNRQEFAKMNYDWYVSHVPLVNGKIVCRYCGASKLMVKNGRNNSNIRTHYCGQCGKGLYYSLEDWRV